MKALSISDYYMLDKRIEKKNKLIKLSSDDPKVLRLALIGSFTLRGIKEVLNVKCDEAGLVLKCYEAEYNQYNQELLDKNSGLYKFKPHLTILFVDTKDLLGENYHFPYRLNERQRKVLARTKAREIIRLAGHFEKNCDGKIIINNFCVPTHSPLGMLESKQAFGFFEMVRAVNHSMEKASRHNSKFYVFDYDAFLSRHGKIGSLDEKMQYIADMKLNQNLIPFLCDEYMRYVRALKGNVKKCIALDLDNTLWGGIIGEAGFDGIKLGPTPPGNAFMEFQRYLLSLFERGVILAINSNNNYDDAIKVIKQHPHMILREDKFASIKINWDNKANNLVAIAKELNIGFDSMLYIDDDMANRQLIKEMLPQVSVFNLPRDPASYASAIKNYAEFDTFQITEEDTKRGAMYAQERKRKEIKKSFSNISDFLAHLDIKVNMDKANDFSIPRLSQLAQRTNQFNLTARRYTEEEMRRLVKEPIRKVYSIKVSDKFGDIGISGMVSIKPSEEEMIADSFLLSCRILGKEIEKAVTSFLITLARSAKKKYLVFEYIPTEKNEIALKFLKNTGFRCFKKDKKSQFWRIPVIKKYEKPKHIKMTAK